MKCPRCQQENPPQAKFCLECGTPLGQVNDAGGSGASYAGLRHALAEAHAQTTEAREQQTATAEILRVISSSPTDAQPVFDAIVASVQALSGTGTSAVFRVHDDVITVAAADGVSPAWRAQYPRAITPDTVMGRAIIERHTIHAEDLDTDPTYETAPGRLMGVRTILGVPMLKDGEPIGVIAVWRWEVKPFSAPQIALLETFADQAVIAIENVRLFTELQEKNQALAQAHAQMAEALDQQTATAEILRVISSSPTSLQPVLDAVAENAARVCEGQDASVLLVEGSSLRRVAHTRGIPVTAGDVYGLGRDTVMGRAVIDRRTVHVEDLAALPKEYAEGARHAAELGHRTTLATPLLREGEAIGVLLIRRLDVRLFTDAQVTLLETFAAQAVIAIENVRLFKELETRNRDLTEALERQTATSEILRAISGAQTDINPVFDAIARSAVKLCGAFACRVFRAEDELLAVVGEAYGTSEARALFHGTHSEALGRDSPSATAVRERRVVQYADVPNDPDVPERYRERARARGYRSLMAVPMVRDQVVLGTIAVARAEPGRFSDKQVALLQTFADQAVIAIENVRLLKELEARTEDLTRSVGELTALGEVSRALSSTLDLETVLQTIVARAVHITGTAGCTIWEYDDPRAEFRLRASHYADERDVALLQAPGRVMTIPKGQGVTTQVMERRQPVQIPDITTARDYESPIRGPLVTAGHRALLGVPLLSEDEVIGVLGVTRKTPGEFEPEVVRLLSTFATQSALAIQNARLFLEIEDKSRQVEAASQHKSEFLANMSHELRTPLNAVIGFSEVLRDRMFGDLNEKQEEYLNDIHASGQHLLSLINDILDLSKIEAGRMELELTDFDLPTAIENALTLVRERAGRRGIALHQATDEALGQIRGDERKIKQALLNLLSNAIKFTPDGGRIDVRAKAVDGSVEVSVSDTGVGIAPEDQEAIFEEFRQVGTADKKVEGTGLGLAVSRKFVELHGGRIWVQSQVGTGSTFTFTIPVRCEE
jgi:two-component system, NtrC family, sensor kinase